MLALPMYSMLVVAFCALGILIYTVSLALIAGRIDLFSGCMQLIFAVLLLAVGTAISKGCLIASLKKQD